MAELVTGNSPTVSARRVTELVYCEFCARATSLADPGKSLEFSRIGILWLQLLGRGFVRENFGSLLFLVQFPQV